MKVGDTVRVIKKVMKEEGWDNSWVGDMDQYIGQSGKITVVSNQGMFIRELGNFGFPPSSLEVVGAVAANPLEVTMDNVKKGDRVYVAKRVDEGNTEARIYWNREMDDFIGTVVTVRHVYEGYVSTEIWDFAFECLELLDEKPVAAAEKLGTGDVIRLELTVGEITRGFAKLELAGKEISIGIHKLGEVAELVKKAEPLAVGDKVDGQQFLGGEIVFIINDQAVIKYPGVADAKLEPLADLKRCA